MCVGNRSEEEPASFWFLLLAGAMGRGLYLCHVLTPSPSCLWGSCRCPTFLVSWQTLPLHWILASWDIDLTGHNFDSRFLSCHRPEAGCSLREAPCGWSSWGGICQKKSGFPTESPVFHFLIRLWSQGKADTVSMRHWPCCQQGHRHRVSCSPAATCSCPQRSTMGGLYSRKERSGSACHILSLNSAAVNT